MAIHVEFLEAGTGWMSGLTGGFGAPSGSAGILQPLPLHRCSLHLLLVLGSGSILPFSSSIPENSPHATSTELGLLQEGRAEIWGCVGVERDLGMAETSNLHCVISIQGEQNVMKTHIPTKHHFPRPFPVLPACFSLSATKEILQGGIRAAWHSQTSFSHPGNTGRFSSQENMEIKLESLHGCSSAQINSQAVSLQMFLAAGTSFLGLFPASQGFWKCFPSSIYGPQLSTRIEIL